MQHQISLTATKIEASKLMTYNAARMFQAGLPITKEAAMAKYFASEVRCIKTYESVTTCLIYNLTDISNRSLCWLRQTVSDGARGELQGGRVDGRGRLHHRLPSREILQRLQNWYVCLCLVKHTLVHVVTFDGANNFMHKHTDGVGFNSDIFGVLRKTVWNLSKGRFWHPSFSNSIFL